MDEYLNNIAPAAVWIKHDSMRKHKGVWWGPDSSDFDKIPKPGLKVHISLLAYYTKCSSHKGHRKEGKNEEYDTLKK